MTPGRLADAARVSYLMLPLVGGAAVSGLAMRYDLLRPLARPIDGGTRWRGRRLFGDNKTWRGLACAMAGGAATAAAQKHLIGARARRVWLVDYRRINAVTFGAALGAAAIVGELPNSALKRQLGVAPGTLPRGVAGLLCYAVDQVDFLVVFWPVVGCWARPTRSLVLTSVGVAALAHQLISLAGHRIGARPNPFA